MGHAFSTLEGSDPADSSQRPVIIGSSAWSGNAAIFVNFNEGDYPKVALNALDQGGHLPSVVIARLGVRGLNSSTPYDHYSLLRTLEDGWGLTALGHAAQARSMTEFFSGR